MIRFDTLSVIRENGKAVALTEALGDGSTRFHTKSSEVWAEFLARNAKQPVPLDLSDKAPDPIAERDPEKEDFTPEERKRIRALLK